MTPLSPLHPALQVQPGRYFLDTAGRLRPTTERNEIVAAVIVLAPGVPTRRQAAEEACRAVAVAIEEAIEHGVIAGAGLTDDLRASPTPAEQIRAECANEAAQREAGAREAIPLTTAHPLPVPPRRPDTPTRSMALRKPEPQEKAQVAAAADDEEDFADFKRRVAQKRATRLTAAAMISEPKIDGKRVAAVHREMKLGPPPKKVPTRRALSDGECHRCGIRTTVGCEHFLPFLGDAQ